MLTGSSPVAIPAARAVGGTKAFFIRTASSNRRGHRRNAIRHLFCAKEATAADAHTLFFDLRGGIEAAPRTDGVLPQTEERESQRLSAHTRQSRTRNKQKEATSRSRERRIEEKDSRSSSQEPVRPPSSRPG